jgi:glyoxylase-like metal-dependent hydrolase (beta-lactamase superfamily II)
MVWLAGAAGGRQRGSGQAGGPVAPPGELTRLAEGVYARVVSPDSDAVSNAGVVVLESGVLVFDTHFTLEGAEALLDRIRAAISFPIRYIVNSHFHADHTHGNQAFPGARLILGSTNTRRDMLQKDLPALNQMQTIAQSRVEQLSRELGQETDPRLREGLRQQLNGHQAFMRRLATVRILAPEMTLDDRLSVLDGGREVQLLLLGTAHTDGDVVLFLPKERIAFLGDIFFNAALPNVEDASILEWMKTLREALKLDAQAFLPGHGNIGTRADVEAFLAYFEDLRALVEQAIRRGESLEQLVRDAAVPEKYEAWSFQNFFAANLQKMYAELKSLPAVSKTQDGNEGKGIEP